MPLLTVMTASHSYHDVTVRERQGDETSALTPARYARWPGALEPRDVPLTILIFQKCMQLSDMYLQECFA